MAFLSQAEKDRIAEAIRAAERKTSGELVTVIAQASDEYRYIPMLWASLVALVLPAVLYFANLGWNLGDVYMAQIGVFVVLALGVQWSPIKMRLIPKSVKHRRASRFAREQFFEHNVHRTRDRTGVLLFVSVAEHYVEIIADAGIDDKVAGDAWQGIVGDFVGAVKAGRIADGFGGAVTACGALLAEHFPRAADDTDELPNHLFEI